PLGTVYRDVAALLAQEGGEPAGTYALKEAGVGILVPECEGRLSEGIAEERFVLRVLRMQESVKLILAASTCLNQLIATPAAVFEGLVMGVVHHRRQAVELLDED